MSVSEGLHNPTAGLLAARKDAGGAALPLE